jgi:hypothetical protein
MTWLMADRHGTAVKSGSIDAMPDHAFETLPYRFKVVASFREPAYPGRQITTLFRHALEANRP